MIIIRDVKFDFEMEDEQFALQLYRKWDDFCRSGFVDVATRLLDREDTADGVLEIGRIELDLGTLTQEEFYGKFGKRVEERLGETLQGIFVGAGGENLKYDSVSRTNFKQLIFYLLHGYRGWDNVEEYAGLKQQVLTAIREESESFRQFLLTQGYRESLRKRLVFRLEDEVLCHLVTLTVPNEADFINHDTLFLIQVYSGMRVVHILEKEYRDTVWFLVLTYIWSVSRGFVSRKELLGYTLRGLAARFGGGRMDWITSVIRGAECLLPEASVQQELPGILEEVAYEERLNHLTAMTGDFPEISWKDVPEIVLEKIFVGKDVKEQMKKQADGRWGEEELRKYLSDVQKRQQLLSGLKEEEIRVLVQILLPLESEFIISYAHVLDRGKERGWYEGKAGGEFGCVKWDFIFAVLLEEPVGDLDHKQFVAEVLHRLAAHYGLNDLALLDRFRGEREQLPGWLIGVLFELEEEEEGEIHRETGNRLPEDRQRFIRLLLHPVSCHRLLDKMKESEIYRLAEWIMPEEKEFIPGYAGFLETERERGVFEKHAGGEFRRLKWEFIFRLALSGTYHRKHFTLLVLQELAAYYGLEVTAVLRCFYQHLEERREGQWTGLWAVVRELWIEVQDRKAEVETRLRVENELEMQLQVLERYLLTGRLTPGFADIGVLFTDLKEHHPEQFRKWMEKFPIGWLDCKVGEDEPGMKFYANLLLWWLENDRRPEDEPLVLNGRLQAVLAGSEKMEVNELRRLLACYPEGRGGENASGQPVFPGTDLRISISDFPALLTMLEEYRQKEVVEFVRSRKDKLREMIFSASSANKEWGEELKRRAQREPGFDAFLKEVFGITLLQEGAGEVPLTGDNLEELRSWLTHRSKGKRQQDFGRKFLTDRRNHLRVLEGLKDHPLYQQLWIERMGNIELKRLAVEWFNIEKQINPADHKGAIRSVMVRYTLPEYANLSLKELRGVFICELLKILDSRQVQKLEEWLLNKRSGEKEWAECWYRFKYSSRQESIEKEKTTSYSITTMETEEKNLIEVENAGLVLFNPWFIRLFHRLGALDEGKKEFVSREIQIHMIFVLQTLIDGNVSPEYEEQALFLNRLLVGLPREEALPASVELTEVEKDMVESLVKNLPNAWTKMKNTSVDGLRRSFLQRTGILEEKENHWVLTVNPSGIDVLLDSLPYTISMIKLPWMEKMLRVEWR